MSHNTVTYLPKDGDSDDATLCGVEFKAGVPRELDPAIFSHRNALIHASYNEWFHVGDDPPPAPKSIAMAARAGQYLDRLKEIVADLESGKATHQIMDELHAIASKITESAR